MTGIRAQKKLLVEAVQAIPLWSFLRYVYMNMIVSRQEYTLAGEASWAELRDSGAHRALGGKAAAKRDNDVHYYAANNVFPIKENQCTAGHQQGLN